MSYSATARPNNSDLLEKISQNVSVAEVTSKVVTVTQNSSTELVAANPKRQYLAIQNIGSFDGFLGIGVAATNAGSWKVHADAGMVFEGKGMVYGQVNVICPNGASKFVVLEG